MAVMASFVTYRPGTKALIAAIITSLTIALLMTTDVPAGISNVSPSDWSKSLGLPGTGPTGSNSHSDSNLLLPYYESALDSDLPMPQVSSIYRNRRKNSDVLNKTMVRDAQVEAFDSVAPFVMQKQQLEVMVGRSLPNSVDISLEMLSQRTSEDDPELPFEFRNNRVVFFITPTYRRDTQMLDLIRLSQTLQLAALTQVGIVYWIIIEDAAEPSTRVRRLLQKSGLPFAHVAAQTPKDAKARGVSQRNLALKVVRQIGAEGVIYFGDDDNAYDADLITELTRARRLGVFGVALISRAAYERCSVDPESGKVTQVFSGYTKKRKFGIDMGGFVYTTALDNFKGHLPRFHNDWPRGRQEMLFLAQLADDYDEMEPLAADCTKMLVWHVKTHVPNQGKITPVPGDDMYEYVSTLI